MKSTYKLSTYHAVEAAMHGYELIDQIANTLLIYGMDMATQSGLELEQLLSPDLHVITDMEILIGIKTPVLKIIAPFLLQAQHFSKAVLLANNFQKPMSIYELNEPEVAYNLVGKYGGADDYAYKCLNYLQKQHAKMYNIVIQLAGLDPLRNEILHRNSNNFIDFQYLEDVDLNTTLVTAFTNSTYQAILELRGLLGHRFLRIV